jgi:phage-related protein
MGDGDEDAVTDTEASPNSVSLPELTLKRNNIFVTFGAADYDIEYFSAAVQEQILGLPDTLAARYVVLTRRMQAMGPNLGEPHTKALGEGLFELRLKGAEGIARVFYCTLIGRRIVMLHGFVKKTDRTPKRELAVALVRLKETKREDA